MQHVIASYVRKKEHLWGLQTHFLHFFASRMEGHWILPISSYFCDFLDCEQLMVKLVTTLLTWKCPICRGMAPPPLDYDYNELIV